MARNGSTLMVKTLHTQTGGEALRVLLQMVLVTIPEPFFRVAAGLIGIIIMEMVTVSTL